MTAALEQAQTDLQKSRDEVTASWEAFEIGISKEWGRKTLVEWQTGGHFTLPIDLARGLTERDSTGAEWKTEKDVMHFELDANKEIPKRE